MTGQEIEEYKKIMQERYPEIKEGTLDIELDGDYVELNLGIRLLFVYQLFCDKHRTLYHLGTFRCKQPLFPCIGLSLIGGNIAVEQLTADVRAVLPCFIFLAYQQLSQKYYITADYPFF